MASLRNTALDIAGRLLFQPYAWGGDDPVGGGFDCSGFVIEVLKSVGVLPSSGDWTAAELALKWRPVTQPKPGCLMFWGKGGKITHVEMVWRIGPVLTIGASGGGSGTRTLEDAIRQNAYVKIRPARSDALVVVDPFQGT